MIVSTQTDTPGSENDSQVTPDENHSQHVINGHRIRVRVQGEGPALLLLNGWTRPMESWGAFTAALTGRRVVTFDAPGVGSSPAAALSMSSLASLATGVLDAVGVKRADVLGFSHGGAVAQQLAIQTPHRVNRLVLAGTLCGAGAIPGDFGALFALRDPKVNAAGTLLRLLAIASWSSVGHLHQIAAQTLVVVGADDRVALPANSRFLASQIRGAELVVLPGLGHDLQTQTAALVLASAVGAFLTADHELAS